MMYGFTHDKLPRQPLRTMRQAARELGVGRNNLYAFLREREVLNSENELMAAHVDSNHFEVGWTNLPNGSSANLLYITGAGMEFLRALVRECGKEYIQSRSKVERSKKEQWGPKGPKGSGYKYL